MNPMIRLLLAITLLWSWLGPATAGEEVSRSRSTIGAPQMRTWVAVNRQVVADADPDTAGQYVSVEYESRFANKPEGSVRELVSFHLDQDRIWRFSGYVLK